MKRIAILAIALAFSAGCNTLPFFANPLEPTDLIRTRCATISGATPPDGVLAAMLTEVDAMRQQGVSKLDALQIETQSCITGCEKTCTDAGQSNCSGKCAVVCTSCMSAIVNQIYGQ